MKIILPAIINPPRIRKDRSVSLTVETRELMPDEVLTILSLSGSEGWFAFAPNQEDVETPDTLAEVEGKTPSERLRSALYVLYKQRIEEGQYVGLFDTFYKEQLEKLIEFIKGKIH